MDALPLLYQGSVKDVLGPFAPSTPTSSASGPAAVVFDYSDAYSVFDWGRMPDLLPRKGEALAVLAADLFQRLEKPETWREFSRRPEAQSLRKGSRFGSSFIELGEKLQQSGLRTHYLGLWEPKGTVRGLVVKQVTAVKPVLATVLGRTIPDYQGTRASPAPRLIPLEVVFRFSLPPGSSLVERVASDPDYLAQRGFPDYQVAAGAQWDFPVLELFSKLETVDRPLNLSEGLAISGISGAALQEMLFKTAWTAAYLRALCAMAGLELADGKLEWGISETGEVILVDAIGPDELRLLKGGVQLSKEFLRDYYRRTPWYDAIRQAKGQASSQGVAEWKKWVSAGPPALPPAYRELGVQLYLALTNLLIGRQHFGDAWELNKVIQKLSELKAETANTAAAASAGEGGAI